MAFGIQGPLAVVIVGPLSGSNTLRFRLQLPMLNEGVLEIQKRFKGKGHSCPGTIYDEKWLQASAVSSQGLMDDGAGEGTAKDLKNLSRCCTKTSFRG